MKINSTVIYNSILILFKIRHQIFELYIRSLLIKKIKDLLRKIIPNFLFDYFNKIKIEKYKKNKSDSMEIDILGDNIFCYHQSLNCQKILNQLQYRKGLNYFLKGFKQYQVDITEFIKKFKSLENKEGYVSKSFFNLNINSYYKFTTGPFTEQIFKIIEIQKNRIDIILGKLKTTINYKDFLFSPL